MKTMELPKEIEDVIFRYKHELEFAASLKMIRDLHAYGVKCADERINVMWFEWGIFSPRFGLLPEKFAPGGSMHRRMQLEWYKNIWRGVRIGELDQRINLLEQRSKFQNRSGSTNSI